MSKFKRRDFIKAAAVSSIVPSPMFNLLNALGAGRKRTFHRAACATSFPQIGITIEADGIRSILSGPSLSLSFDEREHPDGAIRPGQPLHLEWEVYDWRLTATGGPSPDSRYRSAGAFLTFNGNPIWSGTDRRPIISPDRFPRGFYRLNQFNQLRLEVRESQASTNFISGRRMLEVVADNYPTWEWTVAGLVSHWKDVLTISGRMRNNSRFSGMTIAPALHEDENTHGGPAIPLHTYSLPASRVNRTGPVEVTFLPPIQWTYDTWRWFDRILLVTTADLERLFQFTVNLTATDDYENSYELTSAPLDVITFVPLVNRAALLGAFTARLVVAAAVAAGLACLLTIYTAPAAPWWFGVAATAESIAEALIAEALDPPEADPRYLERISFAQDKTVKQTTNTQVNSLMDLLDLARRLINIPPGLSLIEGKLIGARQANDPKGIELQSTDYVTALQSMITDAEKMMNLLPVVKKELSANPIDMQKIQEAAQTLQRGFSAEVTEGLSNAKMPEEGQRELEKAMQNADVAKQATDMSAVVEKMAIALGQLTILVRDGTAPVLQRSSKSTLKVNP